MEKIQKSSFFAVLQGLALLIALVLIGGAFDRGFYGIKAAFGYGGGGSSSGGGASYRPIIVNTPVGNREVDNWAINFPMTLEAGREGYLERSFRSGERVELYVPKKTTSEKITFDVVLAGANSFVIRPSGAYSGTELKRDMLVILSGTSLVPGQRLFYYNEDTSNWEEVYAGNFSVEDGKLKVYASRFGRYLYTASDPNGSRALTAHTFIRDSQKRIWIITPAGKRHIKTLAEFFSYRPTELIHVSDEELRSYPDALIMPNTFVRDENGRIYIITTAGKRYIRSLEEYQSYRVFALYDVKSSDLNAYPNI